METCKRDVMKVSGITPGKWMIQKRLEVANNMIRENGARVDDVYAKVGFKNPSHFSTAFKRQYGVPPTAVTATM